MTRLHSILLYGGHFVAEGDGPDPRAGRVLPGHARGFTLVEMMMVIAVAAILLAAAMPNMSDFVIRSRLSARTSTMVADLMVARSEAARRGQSVTVCGSADGASCTGATDWTTGYLVFVDANGTGTLDAGDRVLRVQSTPSSSDTVTVSPSVAGLTFRSDGSSSATQFSICHAGYNGLAVSVSNVGRTRTLSTGVTCP